MAKIVSMDEAVAQIKDGMTIMVSGFLSAGGPNEVLHAIAEAGVKDLTVICNDGGDPKRDPQPGGADPQWSGGASVGYAHWPES